MDECDEGVELDDSVILDETMNHALVESDPVLPAVLVEETDEKQIDGNTSC